MPIALTNEEFFLLKTKGKVPVIKAVSERTGCSLQDAMATVNLHLVKYQMEDGVKPVAVSGRQFPVQGWGNIPWSIAEEAYAQYAQKFGTSQSLERLAERGGFGIEEMNQFVPNWLKRIGTINQQRQNDKLIHVIKGFCEEVDKAKAYQSHTPGGQQCKPSGDFPYIPPSALAKLQWWARAMVVAIEDDDTEAT